MQSFHQGNSEEESSHEVGTPRNKQENTSLQRWRVSIKGTLKKTVPMTWELTCEDNDRSAQIAGFCLRQPEGTVWGSDCHASSNGPIDSRSWPSSNQSHMWRKYNLGIKQRAFWTQTKDATAQAHLDYKAKWIVLGLSTSPRTHKHPHQRKERKGREVPAGECVISTTVKPKFPRTRELRSRCKGWLICILLLWA